jgi:hypothetical protein
VAGLQTIRTRTAGVSIAWHKCLRHITKFCKMILTLLILLLFTIQVMSGLSLLQPCLKPLTRSLQIVLVFLIGHCRYRLLLVTRRPTQPDQNARALLTVGTISLAFLPALQLSTTPGRNGSLSDDVSSGPQACSSAHHEKATGGGRRWLRPVRSVSEPPFRSFNYP